MRRQDADTPIVLDETCIKPWGKLRLLTSFDARKACFQGPRSFDRQLGGNWDVFSSQNLGSSGAVTRNARSGRLRRRGRPAAGQGQGKTGCGRHDTPYLRARPSHIVRARLVQRDGEEVGAVGPGVEVGERINLFRGRAVYSAVRLE